MWNAGIFGVLGWEFFSFLLINFGGGGLGGGEEARYVVNVNVNAGFREMMQKDFDPLKQVISTG